MVALSFAADAEANLFHKVVTTSTSNRTKRDRDRPRRKCPPGETVQGNETDDTGVVLRNAPNAPTPSPFSQMPQANAFVGNMGMGNGRDKKRSNRKITKADISMPTDFKHIVHVGWSAQKGYDLNNEEVSTLNAFLEKAGVSEQQLNDRDTRAYIYDFIQSNNVLDSVKSEKEQRDPPPVPSRNVMFLIFTQIMHLLNRIYFSLIVSRMLCNALRLHHHQPRTSHGHLLNCPQLNLELIHRCVHHPFQITSFRYFAYSFIS